jgi:hypothetical protein
MQLFKLMTDLQTTQPPPINPTTDVMLPELEIPIFDGNVMDWPSFRDMFKSIVEIISRLSNLQKLAHVKTSVTGEVARLIKTPNFTDCNYDITWKHLNERYQNERELLFHIYRRLMGQPNATDSSSLVSSVKLQQIWEHESLPATRVHTLEEENAEQHFKDNVTRDFYGRYHISHQVVVEGSFTRNRRFEDCSSQTRTKRSRKVNGLHSGVCGLTSYGVNFSS